MLVCIENSCRPKRFRPLSLWFEPKRKTERGDRAIPMPKFERRAHSRAKRHRGAHDEKRRSQTFRDCKGTRSRRTTKAIALLDPYGSCNERLRAAGPETKGKKYCEGESWSLDLLLHSTCSPPLECRWAFDWEQRQTGRAYSNYSIALARGLIVRLYGKPFML